MVCWFPPLQPQPFTNLSNVLLGSGCNTLQSRRAAHNGYLCAWQVYFSHSARVIYFHGRVIHTTLVFMRCCIDIFVLQVQWGWGRQTKFKCAQLRDGSELRRLDFLLLLHSCPLLKLLFWQILHIVLFCFIICASQTGVPGAPTLEGNFAHLRLAPLSSQTLTSGVRTTSKGRLVRELTQWLKQFLGKRAKAINSGQTSFQLGTHPTGWILPQPASWEAVVPKEKREFSFTE